MHGVAAAAHFRRRDRLPSAPGRRPGALHRHLLRLLERPIELVRRTDEEVAGEGRGEAAEARIGACCCAGCICSAAGAGTSRCLPCRAPCDGTRRTRCRRARAPRSLPAPLGRSTGGRRTGWCRPSSARMACSAGLDLVVDRVLALAHDAVTAQARVLDLGLVLLLRMESVGLARELREKDRVAPGNPIGEPRHVP